MARGKRKAKPEKIYRFESYDNRTDKSGYRGYLNYTIQTFDERKFAIERTTYEAPGVEHRAYVGTITWEEVL